MTYLEETLEDFISYKLGYRITATYVKKSYGSVDAILYVDYQDGVTKAVTQSKDNTSLNTDDWMIANNNVLKDIEEINKWVEERKRLSQ